MRLRCEWLWCTLVVLVVAMLLEYGGVLRRIDTAVYDWMLGQQAYPASQEIVIVAIDEASLVVLGPWPLAHQHHASMLTELAEAKPKAVALDALLLEPSPQPGATAALERALRLPGLGAVFLPVVAQSPLLAGHETVWKKPTPALVNAATGLGHMKVNVDEDGVVRSMHIFADAAHNVWHSLPGQLFMASASTSSPTSVRHIWPASSLKDVLGEHDPLIPFSKRPNRFQTVSYLSLVHGEIPASVLAGKLVLVGATAKSVGEHYPSALSRHEAMVPSVVIAATALEGMLERRLITQVSPLTGLAITLTLTLAWMMLLFCLGPQLSMLGLIVVQLLAVGSSMLLFFGVQVWWPNASLLAVVLLGHLLWSWRRVTVLFLDLKSRVNSLNTTEGFLEFHNTMPNATHQNEWHNMLGTLDTSLRKASLRKKRVADTLYALPEAVLLTDAGGYIEMANARAYSLLQTEKLETFNALALISKLPDSDLQPDSRWRDLMQRIIRTQGNGLEVMLTKGSYVLLRVTAIKSLALKRDIRHEPSWWIVILVDVSKEKLLQRQRNDAMQLLWHDLRAPQSAILTLLRTAHDKQQDMPVQYDQLRQRIEAQVHATLGLADDFVWQLRAESDTHDWLEVDIVEMVNQVIYLAWPLAQAKDIQLSCDVSKLPFNEGSSQTYEAQSMLKIDYVIDDKYTGLWLKIEPRLVERALFNLIENAIKYSPNHTRVKITLSTREKNSVANAVSSDPNPIQIAEIIVRDEGYGISAHNVSKIFNAYSRFTSPMDTPDEVTVPESGGHGLGLHFVKTVVELHKGLIRCESVPGSGTVFLIELPISS